MSEILAKYAFLPWMRKGIALQITEQENFNETITPAPPGGWTKGRPEIAVTARVKGSKGSTVHTEDVTQTVEVIGPGDVVGIDPRGIVKHVPPTWSTNAEPNYLPHIEFYEEDFPWRYSPARPRDNKLRPWLILVCLKETEFEREQGVLGPLPSIKLTGSGAAGPAFPDPAKTWAWAHVHFNGDIHPNPASTANPPSPSEVTTALETLRARLDANPDIAYSRLICPRKLEPNTQYHAFVLPAYEAGRLAGLGESATVIDEVNAQRASFGTAHTLQHNRYPIYYEWQFKTGNISDFEYLVRQLKPLEADALVGKRPMDVQAPGFEVKYPFPETSAVTLQLEGALQAPSSARVPYPWPNSQEYREKLADYLNLSEGILAASVPTTHSLYHFLTEGQQSIVDDPIVTADVYGRWHALQATVDAADPVLPATHADWINELNLDPRNRAVAGIGVEFVKNNQEALMNTAWGQLGEVLEANKQLNWGALAQQAAFEGFQKNIAGQPAEQVTGLTGMVLGRLRVGAVSVHRTLRESTMPASMMGMAYRRIERPRGKVMRRIDPTRAIFNGNVMRANIANQTVRFAPLHVVADTQAFMEGGAIGEFVETVGAHQGNVVFGVTAPGVTTMTPDPMQQTQFTLAVQEYHHYFDAANWPNAPQGAALDIGDLQTAALDGLNPKVEIPKAVYQGIQLDQPFTQPAAGQIVPIMAYPVIHRPMYEAIRDLGVEYLLPNINLIPNNTITLLETNQRFVEALMAGLNHEFGRELLWREFPTDQRGSYFRQFWDSTDYVTEPPLTPAQRATLAMDIDEMHLWERHTALGTHFGPARAVVNDANKVVVVFKGDLLKKFSNLVIYAQRAKWQVGDTNFAQHRVLDTTHAPVYPLFGASIAPDTQFLGFNLTVPEAKGDDQGPDPGYFFVMKERPGEIRFGVDAPDGNVGVPATWNDLDQDSAPYLNGHLNPTDGAVTATDPNINGKQVAWGHNATNMAQILYQNPVMVCIHASELIP
jgi:hypothetical protein